MRASGPDYKSIVEVVAVLARRQKKREETATGVGIAAAIAKQGKPLGGANEKGMAKKVVSILKTDLKLAAASDRRMGFKLPSTPINENWLKGLGLDLEKLEAAAKGSTIRHDEPQANVPVAKVKKARATRKAS